MVLIFIYKKNFFIDVIPFLRPFQKTDKRGEPIRAIFLTLCICWLGFILIKIIKKKIFF
jgi:amino acid permease